MQYGILFDLNPDVLQRLRPNEDISQSYDDIRNRLMSLGFRRKEGNFYIGASTVSSVGCVLAVQYLDREYSWFKHSLKYLQMVRIDHIEDLRPAI